MGLRSEVYTHNSLRFAVSRVHPVHTTNEKTAAISISLALTTVDGMFAQQFKSNSREPARCRCRWLGGLCSSLRKTNRIGNFTPTDFSSGPAGMKESKGHEDTCVVCGQAKDALPVGFPICVRKWSNCRMGHQKGMKRRWRRLHMDLYFFDVHPDFAA